MASLDRQLWIDGAAKYCDHRWDEIRSEDGTVLYGERCARCGVSWALGRCDGCRKDARHLTLATASGRFCDEDCKTAADKRRLVAIRLEVRETEPYVCRHRHTEGVMAGDGHLIGVVCLGCGKAFEGAGP